MTQIAHSILSRRSRGGRISSPKLRHSIELSRDFTGLEENVNRYDLLILVKRVGRLAGFSSKMIELLDYYMSFTRDQDWEEGANPIVYQSLSKTALDVGVTERQIQYLEKALFETGAITWNDSGNHRRYGHRCPETGTILFAYGVDLTPLAYLLPELQAKYQEKQMRQKARAEAKRQISWHRSQIRGLLIELEEQGDDLEPSLIEWRARYEEIAVQIRAQMTMEDVQALLKQHKDLYESLSVFLTKDQKTQKTSSMSEEDFTHLQITNQKPSNKLDNSSRAGLNCFQEKRNGITQARKDIPENTDSPLSEDMILKTGLQHVTLKQALNAASSRFRDHMPMPSRAMTFNDFVEAAYKLKSELGISQNSWGRACVTLTRVGAAMCLLLADQAAQRKDDPVRNPPAYFNAMITRATKGELHLHKSVFGLMKREGM